MVDLGAARGSSGAKPQVTPQWVTDRRPHLADEHLTYIRQVGEERTRIELGAWRCDWQE